MCYGRGRLQGSKRMKKESLSSGAWLKILFSFLLTLSSFGIALDATSPALAKTKYSDEKETSVYITKTGKKYHRVGCRYLRYSSIEISKSKALELGKEPCKVCRP